MDTGSERAAVNARFFEVGDLAAATAYLDMVARISAKISPKALTQLTEAPPEPYRELKISARCGAELFERHAWPVIASQVANDPTVRGEPLGYVYTVGQGERVLSVYFEEPGA